jgi:hypothetical protein
LREILKKHKISNEAFASEVSNLHKSSSDWSIKLNLTTI